jgi:flagellar basal-body rod protein FlgG
MLRNVYAPLSAGVGQERLLEILANNMANANTTGYKEDQVSFRGLEADPWPNYENPLPPAPFKMDMQEVYPLHGNEMGYVSVADVRTDYSQGSLRRTDNPLDLAMQGDGFFAVMTPFGERFTRDGSFTLNRDGMLTTKSGSPIQGEKGAIVGLQEGSVRILPSGEVYSGEKYIDKIKTVEFKDKSALQRLGGNLYIHDGSPQNVMPAKGEITQGHIEVSNVNPMKNMTAMIIAHRTYEALQKTIKTHDDNLGLTSSKVGDINA